MYAVPYESSLIHCWTFTYYTTDKDRVQHNLMFSIQARCCELYCVGACVLMYDTVFHRIS